MTSTIPRMVDSVISMLSSLRIPWAGNDSHRATFTTSTASAASAYTSILTTLFRRDDVKQSTPLPPMNNPESQLTQSQLPEGSIPIPPEFTDSPDARSKSITTAHGPDTHGVSHYNKITIKHLILMVATIGLESTLV